MIFGFCVFVKLDHTGVPWLFQLHKLSTSPHLSAESFKSLNSSLAQSTGEVWSCKVAQN